MLEKTVRPGDSATTGATTPWFRLAQDSQIELQAQNAGVYLLQVRDDGVGISKGGGQRNPGSLGLELVNLLVEKLEGAIELQSGPGTGWRIAFHQLHYQERM